jgi:hypothetical protein
VLRTPHFRQIVQNEQICARYVRSCFVVSKAAVCLPPDSVPTRAGHPDAGAKIAPVLLPHIHLYGGNFLRSHGLLRALSPFFVPGGTIL